MEWSDRRRANLQSDLSLFEHLIYEILNARERRHSKQ